MGFQIGGFDLTKQFRPHSKSPLLLVWQSYADSGLLLKLVNPPRPCVFEFLPIRSRSRS